MKIGHVISSIDKESGGTSTYIQLLANELAKDIGVNIATLKSFDPLLLNKNVNIFSAAKSFPKFLAFSAELKKYLNLLETDLFHGNGLWQYPVHAMATTAQKREIPYIISPHGMLEPWALNSGKWKKKLALNIYQQKDLAKATCIHATAPMEASNIRKLGFNNPIAVIPNGIDLKEFPIRKKDSNKKNNTLLFLSRIHPKKGIETLIEAWSQLTNNQRQNWKIEIAGNGTKEYISSLQNLINTKKLENEIQIIGPQFREKKIATYHQADLFVLPSYSENFGIVVAEALACGIPVITTNGTPWEELNTFNAGWCVDVGIEPLIKSLEQALQLTDLQRLQMGKNGRLLIENNYSIESTTKKTIQLYNWIINKTSKPDFPII